MNPTELERWWRHAPGACLRVAEKLARGNSSERARGRHLSSRIALLDLRPRVGVAWFPVVHQPGGAVEGFLVQVVVGGGRPIEGAEALAAWFGGLLPEAEAEVRALSIGIEGLPEGFEVRGHSLQLAAAEALVSHFLQRPAASARVSSGGLGADFCALSPIDQVAVKRRICALEAPGAVATVVEASAHLELSSAFGSAWRGELAAALGASASALSRDARRAYLDRKYPRAERLAELALDTEDLPLARWVRGACRVHRGEQGLEDLELAFEALRHSEEEAWLGEELEAFLGIALLDELRPVEARPRLERALARLEDARRDRRFREVAVQVAGTLRRVLQLLGEVEDALQVHQTWVLGHAHQDHEHSRALIESAALELALERPGVERTLELAERQLAHCSSDERAVTRRYIEVQRVRAGLSSSARKGEPPDWSDFPQPLEALAGLCTEELESWLDDYVDLATLGCAMHLVLLGAAARSGPVRQAPELVICFRERTGPERLGAAAWSALAALEAGDCAPWRRLAPY